MLQLQNVAAAYGTSRVLFDIDLSVFAGEVTALMGRNGMGKTTSIMTLMGLVPLAGGHIEFQGQNIAGWPPEAVARSGIGLVPEGRQIFPNLNVLENLQATARPGPWDLRRVLELFPRLQERRQSMGNQLSGGEQQMLAIGRALMTNPSLLILDEATEGLAPLICDEIWRVLAQLRQTGQAALIVDKNWRALDQLADQFVVIEKGQTVWSGRQRAFHDAVEVRRRFLGV